jgi:N-acetylneuraminic acid mutarotase
MKRLPLFVLFGAILTGVIACMQPPPAAPIEALEWQTAADAPLGLTEAQGVVAGDKLYVFGGYTSFSPFCTTTRSHVYDPVTDSWTSLPDIPEAWTHAGVVADEGDIYMAGGYLNEPNCEKSEVATTTVYRYDVAAATWHSDLPPLPEARGSGGLVRLGRDLHFFGGTDTDRIDRSEHWVLSLEGGSPWRLADPLPNPRNHMGYAALGGRIYAIGGQHSHEDDAVAQTSVHRYNPDLDLWTEVASLPTPLSHQSSSTFVIGNRIMVIGGEEGHNNDIDTVLAYDPVLDAWTILSPLPEKLRAGVGGAIGEEIIFTGGGRFSTTTYRGVPVDLPASALPAAD